MLPTTHKILFAVLLSSLTPYIDEITQNHHGQKYIRYWSYILYSSFTGEGIKCSETIHHLFIEFEKAYDSASR